MTCIYMCVFAYVCACGSECKPCVSVFVHACVRACVYVCACVCVRACVCDCVHAFVCVRPYLCA